MYVTFLALTLYSNFYIGWAVCLFTVLWFVVTMCSDGNRRGIKRAAADTGKFALMSLIAGALCAFVLLPVVYGMQNWTSSSLGFDKEIAFYHKLPQIIRRAPHGEHNNVRTVCDGVVDLRLRVGIHRIDARHDLGLIADGGTDFCNILRCMVGLHRIHPALTLCLSQHLHVNEDAVNACVRRNFRNRRIICDIHEFQHLISLRPSRRY